MRTSISQLIELHGLSGQAQGEILERLATHYQLNLRMDESKAALIGGALTGALVGLKADVASGGLTLGGGLLAGGLLGALGAAGLARAVNLVRGTDRSWIAWNAEALDTLLEAALLRYLAVAHFGRGRGDWERAESPPHWQPVVERALAAESEALASLWEQRGDEAQALAQRLQPIIDRALRSHAAPAVPAVAGAGLRALGEPRRHCVTPTASMPDRALPSHHPPRPAGRCAGEPAAGGAGRRAADAAHPVQRRGAAGGRAWAAGSPSTSATTRPRATPASRWCAPSSPRAGG